MLWVAVLLNLCLPLCGRPANVCDYFFNSTRKMGLLLLGGTGVVQGRIQPVPKRTQLLMLLAFQVVRPILGITIAPPQTVRQIGLEGVLILEVPSNAPAYKAGLRGTYR